MKLEKFREDAYEFTGLTSERVRSLAYAGIAIIWLFKNDTPQKFLIPGELFWPLLFLVITLFSDFMQYATSSLIWTVFYRRHEKEHKGKDQVEITAPYWLTYFGNFFFVLKIASLFVSYFLIAKYLITSIKLQ